MICFWYVNAIFSNGPKYEERKDNKKIKEENWWGISYLYENRFKTWMSRVERQGKLWPDINSVYDNYNNSVYKYNVLQAEEKCLPPAQNRHAIENRFLYT